MMKVVAFLVLAIAADHAHSCCVDVFEHVNYQGRQKKYCGDTDFPQINGDKFNDIISSAKVQGGCTARMFEHGGYQGRELAISGDVPNFIDRNFNDIVSAIRLQQNAPAQRTALPAPAPGTCCIEVFEHVNYQGRQKRYCGDTPFPQINGDGFNDIISSAKVQPGCSAKLFEHDYKGRELDLTGDEPNFINRNFNDIVSSIKQQSAPAPGGCCIDVFEHVNYQGRQKKYCGDTPFPQINGDGFNDIISSAKVQPGCSAKLFEHDYKGRELDLTGDEPNFINRNFNDIVSSIRLQKGGTAQRVILPPPAPAPAPAPAFPVLPPLTVTSCDVAEPDNAPNDLCASQAKCDEYCKGKFAGELIRAECSPERANKKRECVCRLKCCNQGCWGDPHCWTCDGVKFGYQGLKKHYMLKPVDSYPTIPYFTISQINKVWQKGPMAILDISEVFIRDWKLVIEVKTPDGPNGQFSLKVNDKAENIPWRFSKTTDHREKFVNIAFGNAQKTQVVLTTSFGLRIVYTTQGAGDQRYTDLSIDTPRHPELKDRTHGLLGRWNDNPADDSVDATGKKQPLDDGFSWAFGDSWIVPGGRTPTAECVREGAVKDKEEHVNRIDPKIKEQAEKRCNDALSRPEFTNCARKLHRAIPLIKNCILDLIFLDNEKARDDYVKELIASFTETCKRRGRHSNSKDKSRQEEHHGGNEEAVGLEFEQ